MTLRSRPRSPNRRAPGLLALATVALLGSLAAHPEQARAVTIDYEVSRAGDTRASYTEFKSMADEILNDRRGWSLSGLVRFRRVASGGSFTVRLTEPAVVGSYGGCSSYYSCRVGRYVMINDDRWRYGTLSFRAKPLALYRQMVINHEVGHALGFGHADCAQSGARAPVMQQQSKGLNGCRHNAWPLHEERRAFARRLGLSAGAIKPETDLLAAPRGTIARREATFAFDSNDNGASYICRLDSGRSQRCSSRWRYSGLAEGLHTFRVRAIDGAGNEDPTPAIRRFRVDTVAPETAIRSGPGGATSDASPTFGFTASERGVRFRCQLDSGAPRACTSPTTYTGLRDGPHTVRVRAVDAAGNVERAPALRSFRLDRAAPLVRSLTVAPAPFDLSQGRRLEISVDVLEPAGSYVLGRGIERAGGGEIVRSFPTAQRSRSGVVTFIWNGQDDSGQLVTDGRYAVLVEVTDAAGNRAVRRREFSVTRPVGTDPP